MKRPLGLLPLAALLSQCSTSTQPVAADRLAELSAQKAKAPKRYKIQLEFKGEDGKTENAPTLTARPGQQAQVAALREFVYPVSYQLADFSATLRKPVSTKSFPVTPVTPTAFTKRNLGYTVELTARPHGAYVLVEGKIIHEKFAGFSRAPGEAISPIVDAKSKITITDNRVDLPNFVRSETPLYTAGLPGVPQVIDLPGVPGSVTITVTPAP